MLGLMREIALAKKVILDCEGSSAISKFQFAKFVHSSGLYPMFVHDEARISIMYIQIQTLFAWNDCPVIRYPQEYLSRFIDISAKRY